MGGMKFRVLDDGTVKVECSYCRRWVTDGDHDYAECRDRKSAHDDDRLHEMLDGGGYTMAHGRLLDQMEYEED